MKPKTKGTLLIFSILLILMPLLMMLQPNFSIDLNNSNAPLTKKLDYIDINGYSDFVTHSTPGGDGTPGNPFVIENLNLNLSSYDCGISIFGTDYHFIIRNCQFFGGGYESGIEIWNAANGTITNNTMTNYRYGILVKGATNINITINNLSYNSWRGLEVYSILASSQFIRVINNTMVSNVAQSGCVVDWVYNSTFINNTCNNNGAKGFRIENSEDIVFINNTANNNGDYGFLVEYSHNNNFTHNTAIGNPLDGFRISDSINNQFYNNSVIGNIGCGFQLVNATYSILTNNTVKNNEKHGIKLWYYSSHNNITLNTIQGNGWDCIYESDTCINNIIDEELCSIGNGGEIPGFQWIFSLLGVCFVIAFLTIVARKRWLCHPF